VNTRLLREAAALVWRTRRVLIVTRVVLAVVAGAVPVAAAWLTKAVLDGIGHGGSLLPAAVGLALTGLVAVILPRISVYADAEHGRALTLSMKDRLYAAVDAIPGLAPFERPRFHDQLLLAAGSGPNGPAQLISGALMIAQAVLTLAGFVVALIVIAPWMVLVVAAAALPGLRAELSLARRRASMMDDVNQAGRREFFYANLLSNPTAAKEIRLFGLGGLFRSRLLAQVRAANADRARMDRADVGSHLPPALLGALAAGAGLVWAILSADAGRLTVGDVAVFLAAVAGTQSGLSSVLSGIGGTHQALLVFGTYQEVVTAPPEMITGTAELPPLHRGIELDDVWFRYADDQPWVLKGLSVTFRAGESTALVGLNGAGKSTIVKLLCRMYDPHRGSIRWDGVDLRDADPVSLRTRVTAVFQDFMAYELTAGENIAVGDLSGWDDPARIGAAAVAAGADGFLRTLPHGYGTMLTRMYTSHVDRGDPSTGVMLSGGQWQRVAVARALMRSGRDLLILDEPSAGLDAEAEYALHSSLRRLRGGRSSVLISHRLSAVRDADTIVVIADGTVAEAGTHATLTAADGVYARLFAVQASGYLAEVSS